jgi:hypothetical protein
MRAYDTKSATASRKRSCHCRGACTDCRRKGVTADLQPPAGTARQFDFSRLPIGAPESTSTRSTIQSRDGETITWTEGTGPAPAQAPTPAPSPAADHCAITSATFTEVPPPSTIVAALNGSRLEAPFKIRATFGNAIPCTCANGEYRQYIRGSFTAGGAPVTHMLGPGRPLDPTTFQEDGDVAAGTVYGYHSVLGTGSRFLPDQATGCIFEGEDAPGITSASGNVVTMNLDFRGDLIDTTAGGAVITSADWSVAGSATIP